MPTVHFGCPTTYTKVSSQKSLLHMWHTLIMRIIWTKNTQIIVYRARTEIFFSLYCYIHISLNFPEQCSCVVPPKWNKNDNNNIIKKCLNNNVWEEKERAKQRPVDLNYIVLLNDDRRNGNKRNADSRTGYISENAVRTYTNGILDVYVSRYEMLLIVELFWLSIHPMYVYSICICIYT